MRRIFVLLILLSNCTKKVEEEPIPKYIVWCELIAGREYQYVQVDSIYSPEEEAAPGLRGALVSIITPTDTVPFTDTILVDSTDTFLLYQNKTAENWLFPGTNYKLHVEFPDGMILEDTTTIPDSFTLTVPQNYDTLLLPWMGNMIWTSSEGAAIYVIFVRGPFKEPEIVEDTLADHFVYLSQDTLSDLLTHEDLFSDTGWYLVEIAAENRDAYNWNMMEESTYHSDLITGAFGGLLIRRIWLFLIP
jgi:hypothetical protein